jgi:ATP-dependent DNA helicase RecG
VLYQGFDKYKVLDRKEYDADIYSNFTDAINYLKSKLNTEYIIKGGPREERLELPEEALREAILNAIAHRDYYSTGNIQVGIYKDRVEIDNPGGLVGKMKVEELFGRSLPRNPLLFGLMQRMNLVEKIGSGLMRIQNAMKEYDLPGIEFEADSNWFKIIFKRSKANIAEKDKDNTREKNREKTREKTREKILNLIREKPEITTKELIEATGLTRRGVEWNLDKLKEEGIIERKGSKKSGYWEIK